MKYILTGLLFALLNIYTAFSCTTFVLKDKSTLIFGRNLDWVSDNGLVVINKRNTKKTALVFPPEIPATWTSKYGSVTFNQFGKEFPYGGINEKGLVIEIMRSDAEYPAPDNRPALNELQWIQYQLDNSETLDDVIANDNNVRIKAVKQQLHFLVCDKNGNTAVLEFKDGKLKVFKDETLPLPILANSYYPNDVKKYEQNVSCRFTKVANHLNTYKANPGNPVDYSFKILNDVALDGSWSIVYDIKHMTIHFKSHSKQTIKTFSMDSFDFDCDTDVMALPINTPYKSKVDTYFKPYNHELNTKIMKDAMRTNQIHLPQHILDVFYGYAKTVYCKD